MPEGAADGLAVRLAALTPRQRELLRQKLSVAAAPVPRDGRPLPASFFQERLWLIDQVLPGSSAYVSSFAVRLGGELDFAALTEAVDVVVARHEVLRTSFTRESGQLVQVVHDDVPSPLALIDVRGHEDPDAEARRLLAAEARTGFDLACAPLLRVRVIRTGERAHVLAFFLHHTVTDGWSNGVVLAELHTVYSALTTGADWRLPPLRAQYADVAAWQRERLTGERLDDLLDHWTARLSGLPDVFDLPLDRPRQVGGPARGATHHLTVPAATVARLRAFARDARVTPFVLVLAALAGALGRWSGRHDVVVGSSRTGRTDADLEDVVGPLLNTIVLRVDVAGVRTGRDLVRRAHEVTVDAHAHADLPFDKLVERLRPKRSATHHPVFQVNFGMRAAPRGELAFGALAVEPVDPVTGRTTKFDLSAYFDTDGPEWSGELEFNTDLFDADTIARLAAEVTAFCTAFADDPDGPIAGLPSAAPVEPAHPEPVADRAVVAPRDRWERAVALAWTQVLGLDAVGATDDFFALGGHSMAGLLAVERIHELTGRRLGLAELFRQPTVEGLAAALRSAATGSDAPFVVDLVPHGTKPPLFFAPPAVGELAVYFPLARALGTDRPLHGLSCDGFFRHGDPGDLTLAHLAAGYAAEIVRTHPDGPYHLCGFSAAGRLALAIAAELAAGGHPVGAVVLLDSAPFGDVAPDPDLATVLARWMSCAPTAAELSGLDRAGQVERVLAAGHRDGSLPPSLTVPEFTQWCRKLELSARALAGHGPLAYPGAVTLIHRDGALVGRDIAEEWTDLPIGALHATAIATTDHLSFVEGAAVPEVAELLRTTLAAADLETTEKRWPR